MKRLFEIIAKFFRKMFGKEEEVIVNDQEAIIPENEVIEEEAEVTETEEPVDTGETESVVAGTPVSTVKILIDNGHGFDTPGKKSPYSCYGVKPELAFEEWEWNREIAKPLVERLVALGYNAELLVPERNDISLSERSKRVNDICQKLGRDNVILISIHANAAGNGKEWMNAKGWSAFTTKGITKSDKLANCLYSAAEVFFKDRKIRVDYSDGDPDWEENFYIIRKTLCPAVLTENFFYDNVDDVKYILSDEGREAVINTHIDGIMKYLGDV